MSIQDGAQVVTGIFGSGKGGDLTVTADTVQLIGTTANNEYSSGLFAQANSGLSGDAGNLTVNTRELLIQDGAQVNAGTFSRGKGGNLIVTADKVQLIGTTGTFANGQLFSSGLFSSANKGVTGDAGDLTINTRELLIQDGAQVSTGTFGSGKGGNLTVTADKVQLIGTSTLANGQLFSSGLFAQADSGSIGNAGDLTINIGELLIQDGAIVSASSDGKGVAGNLSITANSVRLDNGEITAQTLSGNGGNLKLNVTNLLLLRRDSVISTTAGTQQQPGDGGNITINAPNGFIVAVPGENSDITANAYTGKGGRVDIKTFGIFGIQSRQNPTSLSDITASSEFGVDGTVQLNTPNIDPNSGLINLPEVPVDTKVAQACTEGNPIVKSQFTITGRGGLPSNPGEVLNTDAVRVDLVTVNPEVDKRSTTVSTNPTSPTPDPIVEATGWVIDADGNVVLTAIPTTITPHSSWQKIADCRAFNQQQGR